MYLLTYSFEENNITKNRNIVTNDHPTEWLLYVITEYPSSNYTLINWKKLDMDNEHDNKLCSTII